MQLTRAVALLATTAVGFLIVPEVSVSEPEDALFRALPVLDEEASSPRAGVADAHLVSVPCEACDGGADGRLQLEFSVADDTRLVLNGFELYPDPDPWLGRLVADVEGGDGETTTQSLGFGLAVVAEKLGGESDMQPVRVELGVVEVGGRPVDGVPVVNVKLVRAPSGEVTIGHVDVAAVSKASGCTSLACDARELMADAVHALKRLRPFKKCRGPGWRHHGGKSHEDGGWHGPHSSGDSSAEKQQGPPHGHHHHHHHHHHPFGHGLGWRRMLTHVAAQVLLPILMGITAGAGVALVAMAACSLLFKLAGSVRGARKEKDDFVVGEEAVASEKARLLEVAALPPRYEDDEP